MTEFWNEALTKASWEKLQELSKKYGFVLIGGWSAFLWTGMHKSKDIDVVVGFKTLEQLKQDFALVKNERLRKYEVRFDGFDLDVYVPFYSRLALPLNELTPVVVQGIKTVPPEELLILKQGAEIQRRHSTKGRKDAIDILALLLNAGVNLKEYKRLLKKHGLSAWEKELETVVKEFDERDLKFLNIGFKQFGDWRKTFLTQLKAL